jgi:glucosylglycerate synthase
MRSHNDAGTIGTIARAIRDDLSRAYASDNVRFVLADAGSIDGTVAAARDAIGSTALVEVSDVSRPNLGELPYHGDAGRAAALRAILETADRLHARACAVIDAGVTSIEPAWIERLVAPVLADGFDYVSPYCARHLREGAITRSIVYPMVRALYGARLRQPAATEFGCSGRLATHYLAQDFWDADRAAAGIDLWLAVAAVCGEFRVCEVTLRTGAAVAGSAPVDLSTTLAQVVGACFADLERRADVWQRVRVSAAVPAFDAPAPAASDAPPLDVEGLMESFRLGYRELREIWTFVLPPRTIVELRKLTQAPGDRFRVDDRLWAGIVYDFALGYTFRVLPHDHLLRSLTPLYTGWLASFVLEMTGAAQAEIDARVEQVCLAFELEKRYLISRWRWPHRFR